MNRVLLKILLTPLSAIYGIIVAIRNYLFDNEIFQSLEFRIPVISIGNITVGGTGKTPHVEYLVALLSKHFRVAVLSRGYKRSTQGFIISPQIPSASEIGDEPAQMKLKYPGLLVAVDENRRNGIRSIMDAEPGIEVILLDDAYQHRWVKPGLSILLTDYYRLFTRDHLLPYGRLREQKYNRRRADIIIVSKTPTEISPIERRLIVNELPPLPHQNLYFSCIEYMPPVNIHSNEDAGLTMSDIKEMGSHILLFTGIANPDPLKMYLEKYTQSITQIIFRDHYNYTVNDLIEIRNQYNRLPAENRLILTTEKDSVRLREMRELREIFDDNLYYLPISISIQNNDKNEFDNTIIDYVRTNRANSFVS